MQVNRRCTAFGIRPERLAGQERLRRTEALGATALSMSTFMARFHVQGGERGRGVGRRIGQQGVASYGQKSIEVITMMVSWCPLKQVFHRFPSGKRYEPRARAWVRDMD